MQSREKTAQQPPQHPLSTLNLQTGSLYMAAITQTKAGRQNQESQH